MLPKYNFWKIFGTLVTVFITTIFTTIFGSGLFNIVLGQSKTAEKQSNPTIEERVARVQEEFKHREEKISQASRIHTTESNYSEEEYNSLTSQASPRWNNWNNWNNVPKSGPSR